MKEFPFERAAMQNDPMPEGLTGAEQVLYQGLALVYARYHAGDIDRQTAQKEKLALMKTCGSGRRSCGGSWRGRCNGSARTPRWRRRSRPWSCCMG
ncbi:MAG: hypothetical protein LUD82_10675 [Clostridiales bacterium]|nr:hypothetical protein [Clostridiales bacterium]